MPRKKQRQDRSPLRAEQRGQAKSPQRDASQTPSARAKSDALNVPRKRSRYRSAVIINWRLLIVTAIVLGVSVPSVYALHSYQVQNHAKDFLVQAEKAKEAGNFDEAAEWLFRYLQFKPDDADVRAQTALVFDQAATSPRQKFRAIELFAVALGMLPDRTDLRLRQAELLLEVGRSDEALAESQTILVKDPGQARAERVAGLATAQLWQAQKKPLDTAIATVMSASKSNAGDVELASVLAELLRKANDPDEANLTMDGLVNFHRQQNAADELGKALLARYAYRERYGVDGASQDLVEAQRVQPDNVDALLLAAAAAQRANAPEQAETHYQKCIELAPEDRRAYIGLAALRRTQERFADCIATIREGIAATGNDDLEMHLLLLRCQLDDANRNRTSQTWKSIQDQLDNTRKYYSALAPQMTPAARSSVADTLNVNQAELYLLSGEPHKAVPLLRNATGTVKRTDSVNQDKREHARRLTLLGQGYAALGQWDLAAANFENAQGALGSESLGVILAQTTTLWTGGRSEQASLLLQRSLEGTKEPPATALLLLARIELSRLMRRAATEDWRVFDQAIERLQGKLEPNQESERLLLQVQAAERRGDSDAAKQLLEQAISIAPAVALPAAVLFNEAWGNEADADAALLAYRLRPEADQVRAKLLQVELLIRRQQVDEARAYLQQQIDGSPDVREPLEQRLIRLEMSQGELTTVAALLKARLVRDPDDLTALQQLGELALQRGDLQELKWCEQELERVEGPAGGLWRFFRIMRVAEELTDAAEWTTHADAAQVRRLSRELDGLRPNWPATHVALGRVAYRNGQLEKAITEFEQAVRLGSDNLLVYDWLIRLLHGQNRSSEAFEYINRLRETALYQSAGLAAIAPDVISRSGKLEEAIRMARMAVQQTPQGNTQEAVYAHTWLGVLLTLAANEAPVEDRETRLSEAEAAFQTAIGLVGDQPRADQSKVWRQVFWFYAGTNQQERAEEALQRVAETSADAPLQKALTLAQGYQALRRFDEAETHYDEAAKIAPGDLKVLEARAQFLLQIRPLKAETAWREILKHDPNHVVARRTLSTVLVALGGEDRFAEAISVMTPLSGKADRRLEAILRIRRGGDSNLQAARRLLEDLLVEESPQTPADRAILAGVLERQQNIPAARQQWELLVAGKEPALDFVAQYTAFLLRNKLADQCAPWIEMLQRRAPLELATVQLQCRWMKDSGRPEAEISQVVENYKQQQLAKVTDSQDGLEQAKVLSTTAQIYASLEFPAPTKREFERLLQVWPRDASVRAYTAWLVQQGLFDEAVHIAAESLESGDPGIAAASTLANILIQASVVGKNYPAAEQAVERRIEQEEQPARLLFDLATLRQMQGDRESAERLYRAILAKSPRFVPALNNLSLMLSENPSQQGESLELMQSALSLAGHVAELQDSYAWVLVNTGKSDQAAQLLRQIIDQNGGNSRNYFHLAGAERLAGRNDEARAALQEALQRNLQSELLMPSERELLEVMRQEYVLEGPPSPNPNS